MSTKPWVIKQFCPIQWLCHSRRFYMRKIVSFSLVAASALVLAACGQTETATADNAAAPEVNAADAMEGTTNDAMTNTDAAAGAETNMAADANAAANATDAAANAAGNAANTATNAM
jgi:hypothetical protein